MKLFRPYRIGVPSSLTRLQVCRIATDGRSYSTPKSSVRIQAPFRVESMVMFSSTEIKR